MPDRLPPSTEEKLTNRLSFYKDLGVALFYRDRGANSIVSEEVRPEHSELPPNPPIPSEEELDLPKIARSTPAPKAVTTPLPPAAPAKPNFLPSPSVPSLFESVLKVVDDSLPKTREDLGECTRCKLHKTRHKIVFGDGNPKAQLVFVGEGPGHDEDMQGLPFVGRAGKLLTQMIEAMGLQRKDVYICNVVKCRPPENRQPEDDEVATCSPYLFRQLDVIAPKAVVCLGATAAQSLTGTKQPISRLRGQWLEFRGIPLMATYHPAYLLRNPNAKGDVWEDLKKVMAHLGLKIPAKS